jgi:hypothetical protein
LRAPNKYLTKRIRRTIKVSQMENKGRSIKEKDRLTKAALKEEARKAKQLKKLEAKKKRAERKQDK